jgi:hypothetical protein
LRSKTAAGGARHGPFVSKAISFDATDARAIFSDRTERTFAYARDYLPDTSLEVHESVS